MQPNAAMFLATPGVATQGRRIATGTWVPLVTFKQSPGNFSYVYAPNGVGSGWLYREGVNVPAMVQVLEITGGGPTGTIARVSETLGMQANPEPMDPMSTLMAQMGVGPVPQGNFVADLGQPGNGTLVADLDPDAPGDGTLVADLGGCCVDAINMRIVCTAGPMSRLDGARVLAIDEIHANGLVTLRFLDGDTERNTRLPLCDDAPPTTTGRCCYDAISGVLVCELASDPRHGLPAQIVNTIVGGDGAALAIVVLGDGTQQTVPLCEDPPTQQCPPGSVRDASGNCCPPGSTLDAFGRCMPPGECCEPPPCCDECAESGTRCSNPGEGCSMQSNPGGCIGENPSNAGLKYPFGRKLSGAQPKDLKDPFPNPSRRLRANPVPPPPEPTGLNRLKSGLRTTPIAGAQRIRLPSSIRGRREGATYLCSSPSGGHVCCFASDGSVECSTIVVGSISPRNGRRKRRILKRGARSSNPCACFGNVTQAVS